jgi:hypothetical protein
MAKPKQERDAEKQREELPDDAVRQAFIIKARVAQARSGYWRINSSGCVIASPS